MDGRDLRIFRHLKGLTQREVGEVLDASGTRVSLLENNRAPPTYRDLKILGELYGITMVREWTGRIRDQGDPHRGR